MNYEFGDKIEFDHQHPGVEFMDCDQPFIKYIAPLEGTIERLDKEKDKWVVCIDSSWWNYERKALEQIYAPCWSNPQGHLSPCEQQFVCKFVLGRILWYWQIAVDENQVEELYLSDDIIKSNLVKIHIQYWMYGLFRAEKVKKPANYHQWWAAHVPEEAIVYNSLDCRSL